MSSPMEYAPVHDCAACGARITAATGQAFWAKTQLGLCVLRTCRAGGCEQRALAEHREAPAHRVPPPKVREKDLAAAAKGGPS